MTIDDLREAQPPPKPIVETLFYHSKAQCTTLVYRVFQEQQRCTAVRVRLYTYRSRA